MAQSSATERGSIEARSPHARWGALFDRRWWRGVWPVLLIVAAGQALVSMSVSVLAWRAAMPGWAVVALQAAGVVVVLLPALAWRSMRRSRAADGMVPTSEGVKSPHRWVRAAMLGAVGAVGLLLAGELAWSYRAMTAAERDALMVNVAGRQRMYSQRIGRYAALMDGATDEALAGHASALRASVAEMRQEAGELDALLAGVVGVDQAAVSRARLAWGRASEERAALRAAAERVLADGATAAELTAVQAAADRFLLQMESAVGAMQAVAESRVDRIVSEEFLMAGVLMVVMVFVAVMVVEPTVRLLRSRHASVLHRAAEFERLAEVAERTTNGVATTDRQGRVDWVNQGFTRLTGFTFEEMAGRLFDRLLTEDPEEAGSLPTIDVLSEAEKGCQAVAFQQVKDGEPVHVTLDIQPRYDAEGTMIGFLVVLNDISKQRLARLRAEQALREVTALRSALDKHALVSITDRRGRIVDVNTGFCEISGYDREDLIGSDHRIINSGLHPKAFWKDVWSTIASGQAWRGEVCNRRKDGSVYWVDSTIVPYEGPDGRVEKYVSIRFDITEAKEANQRIERLLQRLSLATEASGIGMWDWNVETDATYFDDTFYTMLGYEPGELPMCLDTWKRLCHPEDLQLAINRLEAHFRGETEAYEFEHRLRAKTGEYRWVRDVGRVVERDAEGAPLRMIGQHIDVDQSRQARNELASLSEQLRLFVEHTPAAVAMFDRELRYLVASRGWHEQYGLSGQDLIGRCHYEIFPTVPDRWREMHARALSGQTLRAERDCFTTEGGDEVWVRWQLSPWHDGEGRIGGIVMFTEVITQQVEHERRLEAATAAAETASRSKSEFLANMSHEIRTPMTAILGFADMLDEDDVASDPARLHDAVGTIRSNARHLLTIINDILDMSKIEAGRMTVERIAVDPVAIVEEVASLMGARASEKGVRLSVRYQGPMPKRIASDPTRLRQVLLNLVGNAVKFTEQGSVTIEVEADLEAERIAFAVVDTGIGLDEGQLERVREFDAFRQADGSTTRRFGGTGLGLRISHALSKMLGGELSVESSLGVGSRFTATVATGPLAGVATTKLATAESDALSSFEPELPAFDPSLPLSGLRILLVEDGIDNQRLVAYHLRKAGAEVEVADHGRAALKRLTTDASVDGPFIEPSPFHLVLTDMQMPEMDGYELARQAVSRGLRAPVVALTAHAMDSDRDRCLAAGCVDYASKPIDREALIETCRRWGRGEGATPLRAAG